MQYWQPLAALAGIGAIASLTFYSLYRDWLKLPIFQQLTKKQLFILFCIFLTFVFLFGIAGIVSYTIIETSESAAANTVHNKNDLIKLIRSREAEFCQLVDNVVLTCSRRMGAVAFNYSGSLTTVDPITNGLDPTLIRIATSYDTLLDVISKYKTQVVEINLLRIQAIQADDWAQFHELSNRLDRVSRRFESDTSDLEKFPELDHIRITGLHLSGRTDILEREFSIFERELVERERSRERGELGAKIHQAVAVIRSSIVQIQIPIGE